MKHGYNWIQYVSFEHEIENRKKEYYQALRSCQAQGPNGDITDWIIFFLSSLRNIQIKLTEKLTIKNTASLLSPKQKLVFTIIQNRPYIQSGEISNKLEIPLPSIKRIVSELLQLGIIDKHGRGRAISYTIP